MSSRCCRHFHHEAISMKHNKLSVPSTDSSWLTNTLWSWLGASHTQPLTSLAACLPDGCKEAIQDRTKIKGCSFGNQKVCFSNCAQPRRKFPKPQLLWIHIHDCTVAKHAALPGVSSLHQIWSPESWPRFRKLRPRETKKSRGSPQVKLELRAPGHSPLPEPPSNWPDCPPAVMEQLT